MIAHDSKMRNKEASPLAAVPKPAAPDCRRRKLSRLHAVLAVSNHIACPMGNFPKDHRAVQKPVEIAPASDHEGFRSPRPSKL